MGLGSESGPISARHAEHANGPYLRPHRISGIGRKAEIRKQQVTGSIPAGGSIASIVCPQSSLSLLPGGDSGAAADYRRDAGRAFEQSVFDTAHATLEPGDALLLYTDGVTDSEDGSGNCFAEERLSAALERLHNQTVENVVGGLTRKVGEFSGGTPQGDDVTALALRWHPWVVRTHGEPESGAGI